MRQSYKIDGKDRDGHREEHEFESTGVSCSYISLVRRSLTSIHPFALIHHGRLDFPCDSGAVLKQRYSFQSTLHGQECFMESATRIGREIARNMNSKVTVCHVLTILVRGSLMSIHPLIHH